MLGNIKNFIIKIEFGIDTIPKLHNRKILQCNWIEALASLNRELRLMNAKNCFLFIDWQVDASYKLVAKRYSDDAILSYTLNDQTWSLHSNKYNTVAANVYNIKSYIEHQRKAINTNILITKNLYKNELKKLAKDDEK